MDDLKTFIDKSYNDKLFEVVQKEKYTLTKNFLFYAEIYFYQQHINQQPILSDFEWKMIDSMIFVVRKYNFHTFLTDLATKLKVSPELIKYQAFNLTIQKIISVYII